MAHSIQRAFVKPWRMRRRLLLRHVSRRSKGVGCAKRFPSFFRRPCAASGTRRAWSCPATALHPCPSLQPLPTALAQQTRVFRQPGFMSRREVIKLRNEFAELGLQPFTNNPADWDEDGKAVHCTHYLNTDGIFRRCFPELRQRLLDLIVKADRSEGWGIVTGGNVAGVADGVAVRVAEYHDMRPGGSLPEMDHYDIGSLVSVDVMLEEPDDGANFQTVEKGEHLLNHKFRIGDALVWVAHKYHRVSKLISGRRRVLVVEFWHGEERVCAHRCDVPWGSCDFTVDESDSSGEGH